MSYVLSKRKSEMLIDMVQKHPILYDPYHENFRNVIMKHQVWETISVSLHIPVEQVKKRWRHFRDHYLKKLKLYKVGLTNGTPWEYMQRMEFLSQCRPPPEVDDSPLPSPSPGLSGGEDRIIYMLPPDDDGSRHSVESDDANHSEPKRRKYSSEQFAAGADRASPSVLEAERVVFPEQAQVRVRERSAVHKFFESMADIVAALPPRQAAEARLRVCQLVTDLEMQVHSDRGAAADQAQAQWRAGAGAVDSHSVKRE